MVNKSGIKFSAKIKAGYVFFKNHSGELSKARDELYFQTFPNLGGFKNLQGLYR